MGSSPILDWTTAFALALMSFSAAADDSFGEVEVVPVEGGPARIISFEAEGGKIRGVRHLGKGEPGEWPLRDVLAVRFPAAATPPLRPSGTQVVLASGETVGCNLIISANSDQTQIRSLLFGDATIPMAAVTGLILDPDATDAAVVQAIKWMRRKRTGDAVLFRNQDEATGSFLELTETGVRMEVAKREKSISRSLALALALDPSLAETTKTDAVYAILRLTDGTTLRIASLETPTGKPDRVTVATTFNAKLTVKLENIAEVSIRNGRAVYLSDVKPKRVEVKPFLDDPMPPQYDRSVLGEPLRLDGQVYSKGVGVRSYTALTYDVAKFSRFEALAGLDDAAGPRASVRFLVQVDGGPAFDSGELAAGAKPKAVRIPLKGAKAMTLIVDYAQRGDVEDFADWCDARFVQ